ncbi:MAG: hypothetical protein AAFU68_14845, partial [Pseudomonadota bacterium]
PGAANVLRLWRDHLEAEAGDALSDVNGCLHDQRQFARLTRQVGPNPMSRRTPWIVVLKTQDFEPD